jgi:hypothetical protein
LERVASGANCTLDNLVDFANPSVLKLLYSSVSLFDSVLFVPSLWAYCREQERVLLLASYIVTAHVEGVAGENSSHFFGSRNGKIIIFFSFPGIDFSFF